MRTDRPPTHVKRNAPPIPARSTWGSLAWGGLGGIGLGFLFEGLFILGVIVVGVIAFSLFATLQPDWATGLQDLAEQMQRGAFADPAALERLLSPAVVLGVLLFASVFVPLVEELAKSLAVPLVAATGRRLTRLDGFLLGVAAGAGFALVEGMLNGTLGLSAPSGWAGTMLTRAGAAGMHCLASGLFGLGWQAVLRERRIGRGLGLAAASMTLHGLWNAAALGIGLSELMRPTVGFGALNLRDVQAVAIAGLLVVLWLLAVVTLAWLPRRLAEEEGL